jgi:hypothetical protein
MYHIEIYYDSEGKCYFHNGWPRFFTEYGMKPGWFLLFTCHDGMQDFFVCIIDGTLCARSFAWS